MTSRQSADCSHSMDSSRKQFSETEGKSCGSAGFLLCLMMLPASWPSLRKTSVDFVVAMFVKFDVGLVCWF